MKKQIIKLDLILLVKKQDQILIPRARNGLIKSFLYRMDAGLLKEVFSVGVENQKEELINVLHKDLYFLNFLVNLGFTENAHIASIDFEYENKIYDFSYLDEECIDNYWSDEPKFVLDEEYSRWEPYGYEFDEYILHFGMDEENYEFEL